MIKNTDIWEKLQEITQKLSEFDDNQNDLRQEIMCLRFSIEDLEKNLTKENIYNSFESCWESIKQRDLLFTENISKINLMINEFKGLIAMSRADFNKRN